MFVELHLLQNFAPSCLNRDDTNSPKDCEFGGYRRARISSQCIKRAIRWHPLLRNEAMGVLALRSAQHARQIAERITKKTQKPFEDALQVSRFMLQRMGFKEKNERLSVMLILGQDEISTLSDAAIEYWDMLAPLANTDLLWEKLAARLADLMREWGPDAPMLGRLLANQKAGKSNAAAVQRLIDIPDAEWNPVLAAMQDLPEETIQGFRDSFHEETEAEERRESEEESDERVPGKAATALKKQKALTDAIKSVGGKQTKGTTASSDQSEAQKQATRQIKAIFTTLKKMTTKAVDVALFGRMIAEIKSGDGNVDAACQVAHALSTNKVSMEMDYFTAVEELKELAQSQGLEQGAGAGMIGTVEFNSACFYRYANIDLRQLKKNLHGDEVVARKTVESFVRASVDAIPTGKQNSMPTPTPPSFVLAVVRDTGLWSLANAFVQPVQPRGNDDLVRLSIQRLDDHWDKLAKGFGDGAVKARPAFVLDEAGTDGKDRGCLSALKDQQVGTIDQLVEKVMATIAFPNGGGKP